MKKSKPSHFYSIFSTAIVLLLLGLFALVILHTNDLSNILKEKIGIVVEFANDHNETQVARIQQLLESKTEVLSDKTVFISRHNALERMKKVSTIELDSLDNPFLDVLRFHIKAPHYSQSKLKELQEEIEKYDGVQHVYYDNATIVHLKKNLSRLAYVLLFIGLIFILLSAAIIRNTIALSLNADRKEVRTMQLVGAKRGFVKMPYLKSAIYIGFKAALIAAIVLIAFIGILSIYLPDVYAILNWVYVAIVVLFVFLISMVISVYVTDATLNTYLK